MLGATVAGLIGGSVAGMAIGDMLGAVAAPTTVVAATSAAATPKGTQPSKSVDMSDEEARRLLWLDTFAIIGGIAVLIVAYRFLDNVRIG